MYLLRVGRNVAAGMTGGLAYILDEDDTLIPKVRCNEFSYSREPKKIKKKNSLKQMLLLVFNQVVWDLTLLLGHSASLS